jgi:hypothetical protein
MRRGLVVGAGVLLFGAGAATGLGVALLTDEEDDQDQSAEITDTEYDRLIDACVTSAESGGGTACAVYVDDLVAYLEPRGCGYSTAIELLDKEMRYPDADRDTLGQWYQEAVSAC